MSSASSFLRRRPAGPNPVALARRIVVAIAAAAALAGLLSGRPLPIVALRAAVVAGVCLAAILVVERALARHRSPGSRGSRGGAR